MSDDRNFREYRDNYKNDSRFITFRKYVEGVIAAGGSRNEEFETLIKFFGMHVIELVLEGKRLIEASDFLKGVKA